MAFAKPVKDDARVGLGKMFKGDVQRVFWRRREFDLEAGMKTALSGRLFFKVACLTAIDSAKICSIVFCMSMPGGEYIGDLH